MRAVEVCDQGPKLDGLWGHHESGRKGEAMTSHMLVGGGIGLKYSADLLRPG